MNTNCVIDSCVSYTGIERKNVEKKVYNDTYVSGSLKIIERYPTIGQGLTHTSFIKITVLFSHKYKIIYDICRLKKKLISKTKNCFHEIILFPSSIASNVIVL